MSNFNQILPLGTEPPFILTLLLPKYIAIPFPLYVKINKSTPKSTSGVESHSKVNEFVPCAVPFTPALEYASSDAADGEIIMSLVDVTPLTVIVWELSLQFAAASMAVVDILEPIVGLSVRSL